ncbi:MAG: hypothetical protein IJI14_02630 [Anaerolineaceae bacterium]|nr:hypothetical protein [Anaerolineaceae bacterium]
MSNKKIAKKYAVNFLLLSAMLFAISPVSAEAKGILGPDKISSMFSIFKDMTDFYIKAAYGIIVILFAVGAVKSGLMAQFSKQFGMATNLSREMSDFIIAVVIFVLGILSYPLVEMFVNRIVSVSGNNVTGLRL